MKVAVQGCCHGELDRIYSEIAPHNVDLLLICGDFQAMRNSVDLDTMACPPKYRRLGCFYEYYSGAKRAPVLTIFIGGNHEASAYMWELYYGGWVAENIYYVGTANVLRFGALRIGGISGIFKQQHYNTGVPVQGKSLASLSVGHFERQPLNDSDIHSIYHLRSFNVNRLMLVEQDLDVMMSHDWPQGIHSHGDTAKLLRQKPFFRADIEKNALGSQPAMRILKKLKPKRWFSAHLHVRFEAELSHGNGRKTSFLALDKCLGNRKHIEIIEYPDLTVDDSTQLSYDEEWLAIVKATASIWSSQRTCKEFPLPISKQFQEGLKLAKEYVDKNLRDRLNVPLNFCHTAAIQFSANQPISEAVRAQIRKPYSNPQTEEFCRMLDMENFINADGQAPQPQLLLESTKAFEGTAVVVNQDEIVIDQGDF